MELVFLLGIGKIKPVIRIIVHQIEGNVVYKNVMLWTENYEN